MQGESGEGEKERERERERGGWEGESFQKHLQLLCRENMSTTVNQLIN